jgi:hypothetical protein
MTCDGALDTGRLYHRSMRFPLTDGLVEEAEQFAFRSACRHCLFHVAHESRCAHEWPDKGQSRWPLDAPDQDGARPAEVAFCKEFELA